MKKNLILLFGLGMCIFLCGCGRETEVSMETIYSDAVEQKELEIYDVDEYDVEIIKRKTNFEDKEDIVYVEVTGENVDYKITMNYKMEYALYNAGWEIEEVELYCDESHQNGTMPLRRVDNEAVMQAFQNYDSVRDGFKCNNVINSEIELIQQDIYFEEYRELITYEYKYFSEFVNLRAVCEWQDTIWNINVASDSWIKLNDAAIGKYKASSSNAMFNQSSNIQLEIYADKTGEYYYILNTEVDNGVWGISTDEYSGRCTLRYSTVSEYYVGGDRKDAVLLQEEGTPQIYICSDGIYCGGILLYKE